MCVSPATTGHAVGPVDLTMSRIAPEKVAVDVFDAVLVEVGDVDVGVRHIGADDGQ